MVGVYLLHFLVFFCFFLFKHFLFFIVIVIAGGGGGISCQSQHRNQKVSWCNIETGHQKGQLIVKI